MHILLKSKYLWQQKSPFCAHISHKIMIFIHRKYYINTINIPSLFICYSLRCKCPCSFIFFVPDLSVSSVLLFIKFLFITNNRVVIYINTHIKKIIFIIEYKIFIGCVASNGLWILENLENINGTFRYSGKKKFAFSKSDIKLDFKAKTEELDHL